MKKRNSWLIMLLLLLVGVTSVYVAGTYAKYTETIDDTKGEATIAKWNFGKENESVTMDLVFDQTYDTDTLKADRIAPGTKGTFQIDLTNTTSEVGVDYTITFGTPTGVANSFVFKNGDEVIDVKNSGTITGRINVGDTAPITIDWEWPYEASNDDNDTTLGKAGGADGTKLTLPITITGVQTEPVVSNG